MSLATLQKFKLGCVHTLQGAPPPVGRLFKIVMMAIIAAFVTGFVILITYGYVWGPDPLKFKL